MSIYLNSATTGYPKSDVALAAMNTALAAAPSDVRHSSEPAIEQCRQRVAAALGFPVSSVFFLSDATLALNCVIQSEMAQSGPCLTDNRAHNAITRTLHGVAPGRWRAVDLVDPQETINLEALKGSLSPSTRLVCLTHTSNVFGTVYDLEPVIAVIRRDAPDCSILVDASQSAGSTDLAGLQDADFIVFPGHKHLHAVPGAAVLVAQKRLRTCVYGGTGTHSSRLSMEEYNENMVEVGTPNLPAIEALTAALEDYQSNGAGYRAQIADLVSYLSDGLRAVGGVTQLGLGATQNRNGTVACLVPGHPEHEWVPLLASQGIVVRGGLHCSPLAHKHLKHGDSGTLRISVSRFTTKDDLDTLMSVMTTFSAIAAQ